MAPADSCPTEFLAWIEEHLGFHAEAPGAGDWGGVLRQRLGATQTRSFEAYSQRLVAAAARRTELGHLARMITVGETHFFRDSRQFEALAGVVLPELIERRAPRPVRVLSVACSSGEEPYSIAMTARELPNLTAGSVKIHAFDVNPAAIAAAERATYSEWALRATPEALRRRYFTRAGQEYTLCPAIRGMVSFETRNLFEDDPAFWREGHYDVIFCRNALIYFSRRKIAFALRRLSDALAVEGVLFLGNAETPRGFEPRLVPREVCGSFIYALGRAGPAIEAGAHEPATEVATAPQAALAIAVSDDTWVRSIAEASQRLARLVEAPACPPRVAMDEPAPPEPASALERARELVSQERFAEALDALDDSNLGGVDVDLVRATVLAGQGRFAEVSLCCRRLLSAEPRCAAAHYLLAVASEHGGRLDEAIAGYEAAVTLEPRFAISHWKLGRLWLRTGRRDHARRHLMLALESWAREDAMADTFTKLYGGGFSDETLERLCRADLARCEGPR